jgi:hypothetical protein
VETTPSAWFDAPAGPIGALRGVDLAVLVLERAIDVTPARMDLGLTALALEESVRVVAMGRSLDGAAGVRRAIDARVVSVDGFTIRPDGSACDGDSGGALFDGEGRVRAVLSTSPAPCGTVGIEFVSVDVMGDAITRALTDTGATPRDAGTDVHIDGGDAVRASGGCAARPPATRFSDGPVVAAILAFVLSRRRGRLAP